MHRVFVIFVISRRWTLFSFCVLFTVIAVSSTGPGANTSSTGVAHNGTRPSVEMFSLYGNATNKQPIPVRVRFSQKVYGFSEYSLSIATYPDSLACGLGTMTEIQEGILFGYDFTLTDTEGTCNYWVDENMVTNADGDYNTKSNIMSLHFDVSKTPDQPEVWLQKSGDGTTLREGRYALVHAYTSRPLASVDWDKI